MFVDSMDCFLTYNLSCVNGTFAQFNSSSVIFGDVLDPNFIAGDDTSNNGLTSSTDRSLPASKFVSLHHCILTSIILGAIILATIAGNILVIAAVKLEKNLHSVAYYLFVSLAVADIMVASMVMPISLLKEITRSWTLSAFICEAWVMIDLLCCTASILHLVAIALDRYWSITNLDYATKRTPARILLLICLIWVTSIIISGSHLIPIFRDKRGRPDNECHLIGNIPYTIISTIGAFYFPLIVMCIIYWKIFQAAKFRIRRRAFNPNRCPPSPSHPGALSTSSVTIQQHDALLPSDAAVSNHDTCGSKRNKYTPISPVKYHKKGLHLSSDHGFDIEQDEPSTVSQVNNNDYQLKPLKKTSYSFLKNNHGNVVTTTTKIPSAQLSTTNRLTEDFEALHEPDSALTASSTGHLTSSSYTKDSNTAVNKVNSTLIISNSFPSNETHAVDTSASKQMSKIALSSTNSIQSHVHGNHNDKNNATISTKPSASTTRKKIDIKRERKATKVLGVVMGCFILCWLPFFLEETLAGLFQIPINEKIISFLTWLGYLNSLLNPVIYTIFSPDFRQAFGKILSGKYRKRR